MARKRDRGEIVSAYVFISGFLVAWASYLGIVPLDYEFPVSIIFSSIGGIYGLYATRKKKIDIEIAVSQPEANEVEQEREINAPVHEEFQFFKDKQKQQ
ncbi:hypothetical protein [Burkholderia contaminans]|uniref:hypothetical protein n=1 Tax=Burkholderia contaminans TaxID=488447 RepID=UPI00158CA78D|nr:hypothetical protein [Burkholderia contaminans]